MKIDISEIFPHLSRAPIVEAVIDLRAKPSVPWDQAGFQKLLKQKLTGYPTAQPLRQIAAQIHVEEAAPPEQRVVDLGWTGLLFRTQDQHNVARFQKEGFAFSRLAPYQNWETFEAEGLRLWQTFVELAGPVAIERIGVRFINQMPFPADGLRLDDYLIGSPQPLPSLELVRDAFFHQETLRVPETGYQVNLIRTAQQAEGTPARIPVILDIDVSTLDPMELDEALLMKRLAEMRWLKNKIFFDSLTPRTKESFQ